MPCELNWVQFSGPAFLVTYLLLASRFVAEEDGEGEKEEFDVEPEAQLFYVLAV